MKAEKKEKIETLEDVFVAWMGGYPETTGEIRTFLDESRLDSLLSVRDVEDLLNYNAYFSAETAQAVYSLMPPLLKTKKGDYALFAQTFNRINLKTSRMPDSRVIAIGIWASSAVVKKFFAEKYAYMKTNYNKLRTINNKLQGKGYDRQKYQEAKSKKSEEEKQKYREQSRLRMQKYRAEHPKKVREQLNRRKNSMSPMEKLQKLLASRRRYRNMTEEEREERRIKRREKRAVLKQENPEMLKKLNKQQNNYENRAKVSHDYYERHKQEIARKARENPKTKIYKQKYKQKQRLKKTGPRLLMILQQIIKSKEV